MSDFKIMDDAEGITRVLIIGVFDRFLYDRIMTGDYAPSNHAIWDCRQADLSELTMEDFSLFASYENIAPGRIAVIVNTTAEQMLGKLFLEQSRLDGKATDHIKLFYSLNEARKWLTSLDGS